MSKLHSRLEFFKKISQQAQQNSAKIITSNPPPFTIQNIPGATNVWGAQNITNFNIVLDNLNKGIYKLTNGSWELNKIYNQRAPEITNFSYGSLLELFKISKFILKSVLTNNFTPSNITDLKVKNQILDQVISLVGSTVFADNNIPIPQCKTNILNNLRIIKGNLN